MAETLFPELDALDKRPRESDRSVLEAAAAAFAAIVMRERPAYLEGTTVEVFREDLLRCLPLVDDDGVELAEALYTHNGYAKDAEAIELMGRWPEELRACHEAAVEGWVRRAAPVAPFSELARVRVRERGPRPLGEGVAYRDDRHDRLAQCLVVTDVDRGRYMRDGAFAGGYIIAWEDIEILGEPTAEDRSAHDARLANEARMERERAFQVHARRVGKAFAECEAAVEAEIATMDDADLAAYLGAVLGSLEVEAGTPGFDPFSPSVAKVTAALRKAQKRGLRASFEAGSTTAPGKPETTP